jgi:hypothetical protein
MNNRNQQTNRNPAPAPTQASALGYLNVFTVDGRLVVLPSDPSDDRSNK